MDFRTRAFTLGAVALTVSLGACGGGGGDDAVPVVDAAQACVSMATMTLTAAQIGLPTSGATVTSATLQAATGSGATAKPEYCKVLAKIAPVDPSSQAINVQLNLPTAWNEKAVQMGGGGYDGVLVTGEGATPGANAQATPLAAGYATFGSDAGHSISNVADVEGNVSAFLNDEVLTNYAGAQLKKTRDLAVALIQKRYGKLPRRTYFVGLSAGGREALAVTQKYGADYDGAVSYFPAAGGIPLLTAFGRLSRTMAAPGAFSNIAKQTLLHSAAVSACDANDGVTDGLISNPAMCTFNVATIRCPSGADEGDTCLSDAQIAAFNTLNSDLQMSFPLASGETGFPRYNVYQGVDFTAPGSGLGSAAPIPMPSPFAQAAHAWLYDIYVRGIVLRDPGANSLAFDPENPGLYMARTSYLSSLLQANQSDLSTFQKRGGKLILVHGMDDALIPVGWSEEYYKSVVKTMGASTVAGFMRFYEVPGYGHGTGSFSIDWNSLGALDDWVEKGTGPAAPVMTDINPGNGGRSRPLCQYPAWSKYNGSGDIKSAASFTCTSP